jgi:hypothetical protein
MPTQQNLVQLISRLKDCRIIVSSSLRNSFPSNLPKISFPPRRFFPKSIIFQKKNSHANNNSFMNISSTNNSSLRSSSRKKFSEKELSGEKFALGKIVWGNDYRRERIANLCFRSITISVPLYQSMSLRL